MADIIYAFVRFFKLETHRDSFLRGDLYMNRLKYFKGYEELDPCNIGDKHEGVSMWHQSDQLTMTIQNPLTGEEHVIEGLVGPVLTSQERHDDYHVYCMSALYCDDQERFESFEALKSHIMLDIDKGDLGDYCSIIDARKFIDRLDKVLSVESRAGHLVGRGLVEYFDPDTFHGSFDDDEAIMRKKLCFSHQKEYRVYSYNMTSGDEFRVLNIGDLSDIAVSCHKTELNSCFLVRENDSGIDKTAD